MINLIDYILDLFRDEGHAQAFVANPDQALADAGADPGRGLDALMSWWVMGVRFAAYRASDVADIIDILRAGGASVSDRHRELAATAGASQVEAALAR